MRPKKLELPSWMDEWTAPPEIRKWFPFYLAGFDRQGSPVYVSEYGKWKFAEAMTAGAGKYGREKLKQLVLKYLEQGIYTALRHGLANNSQGIVVICDWNGFSVSNLLDSTAVELCLTQMTMLKRINDVLNYAFLINRKLTFSVALPMNEGLGNVTILNRFFVEL